MKQSTTELGLEGNNGHALFFPPALPDGGISKIKQERGDGCDQLS